MMALVLISCVVLGKSFDVSVPHLPHLYNGDNNRVFLVGCSKDWR